MSTLREAIADLHHHAKAKAQKYIRSSTLYGEYHGIEVAYETVLKLMDSESNRAEAALRAETPAPRKWCNKCGFQPCNCFKVTDLDGEFDE